MKLLQLTLFTQLRHHLFEHVCCPSHPCLVLCTVRYIPNKILESRPSNVNISEGRTVLQKQIGFTPRSWEEIEEFNANYVAENPLFWPMSSNCQKYEVFSFLFVCNSFPLVQICFIPRLLSYRQGKGFGFPSTIRGKDVLSKLWDWVAYNDAKHKGSHPIPNWLFFL